MVSNDSFRILSPVLSDDMIIPVKYTSKKEGLNCSLPLHWRNPPENTASYALIMKDVEIPVIGNITHWIIFNIPAEKSNLPENIQPSIELPDGSIQLKNIYRRNAYLGPNPKGGRHKYVITLYALSMILPREKIRNAGILKKYLNDYTISTATLIFYCD